MGRGFRNCVFSPKELGSATITPEVEATDFQGLVLRVESGRLKRRQAGEPKLYLWEKQRCQKKS